MKNRYVEAEQWDGRSETFDSLSQDFRGLVSLTKDSRVAVLTPEGPMLAAIGDWIVKDSSNALFVMKSDIFDHKYEPFRSRFGRD